MFLAAYKGENNEIRYDTMQKRIAIDDYRWESAGNISKIKKKNKFIWNYGRISAGLNLKQLVKVSAQRRSAALNTTIVHVTYLSINSFIHHSFLYCQQMSRRIRR